jgi:hypothetical protein
MSSSEFFNSWDIDINEEYRELYHSFFQSDYIKSFDKNEIVTTELFIDLTKKSYSLLEKFIYDIAMFHFKRMNIEFDERIHNIEFWIPPRTHYSDNALHIDCDEEYRIKYRKKKNPFLSTITYLSYDNEMKNPTMVTNIPHNNSSILNKYGILQHNKFYFSFPKFLKHLTFEGGEYYHGILDYFDCAKNNKKENSRIILAVGLWEKELYNINIFSSKCNNLEIKYLRTIPKDSSVVTLTKKNLGTKIIVCKEQNKKSHEFFKLEKITFKSIIKNTFAYILNSNNFNYNMYYSNKEVVYFIEKIKENKEGELYDNFGFNFI